MSVPLNLTIKNRLEDMQIGDCIPCRYTASTSGSIGYFSELGTTTATEIPTTSSATPNGLFYFIKVNKGLLIADRVIQTNISWDTLNNNKFIEGSIVYDKITPILSAENSCIIASSEYSDRKVWKIFNNNYNGYTNGWQAVAPPAWIIYDNKISVIVNGYSIQCTTTEYNWSPKTWKFKGSNDNINWVDLDSRINISWIAGELKTFTFINSIAYRYYKLDITDTTDSGYVRIGEFNIFKNKVLIRALSGGVAYADSTGNKSLTDCGKGAWPVNNEWDKYIVNSNLNNKITPGDDNVWHWNDILSWCKDTPVKGFTTMDGIVVSDSASRMRRGSKSLTYMNHSLSSNISSTPRYTSFRPVLEYIESDNKQTNLFY